MSSSDNSLDAGSALISFMVSSVRVVRTLLMDGGDGLSAALGELAAAEGALRGLGASNYFISKLSCLVIEGMGDGSMDLGPSGAYGEDQLTVDISYYAEILRGSRAWDA